MFMTLQMSFYSCLLFKRSVFICYGVKYTETTGSMLYVRSSDSVSNNLVFFIHLMLC